MRKMKMLCVKTIEVSEQPLTRMEQFRLNRVWIILKVIVWSAFVITGAMVAIEVTMDDKTDIAFGGMPEWVVAWVPIIGLAIVLSLDINDSLTMKFRTPQEIIDLNKQAIGSIEVE